MYDKPFDEGTLNKLELFELYTKEWLPVFLSQPNPRWSKIHLFDFFAGPGRDSLGKFGSPLRTLKQIEGYHHLLESRGIDLFVHFFDLNEGYINQLSAAIDEENLSLSLINYDLRPLPFCKAFSEHLDILKDNDTACLVIIDQYGVGHVSSQVFMDLVNSSTTDFLFFISSSILNRFSDHPDIEIKIDRPDDYYHVHHAVIDYYKNIIPQGTNYYLAPFSFKKGVNIYGLVFGSGHPLGMEKFLRTAWGKDTIYGEADFDIDKEDFRDDAPFLPFDMYSKPTKVAAFEADLRQQICDGNVKNEMDIMEICFEHGVTPKKAKPVIQELRKENKIICKFSVPKSNLSSPRTITLK